MDKSKIVILDIQPITPAVGGGRIRLLGLYGGFKNDISALYIGSYDWRGPKYRDYSVTPCLREIDVPFSEEHFKAHDILSTRLGKGCIDTAFPMQGNLSTEFINCCCNAAQDADIVVFSHPWLFPFVESSLDSTKQLIVYDAHNFEGFLRVQLLDDGTELSSQICRSAVKTEAELSNYADMILACSEEDKKKFVEIYGIEADRIKIVPNGVFTKSLSPCGVEEKKILKQELGISKPVICFIGSSYYPNEEAARMILEVSKELLEYQFIIIGGVSESLKDVDLTKYGNVKITGFVSEDEKADYLHVSDLAINPMLSGSGTNIKMFDFMAAGLPIIATDIGARGITNTNGRVYQLCQRNKDSLGQEITEMFSKPYRMAELSKAARTEAEQRYSWEMISERLGVLLQKTHRAKNNATEKVLMISTYPPEKCGIGTYALQQTRYLRQHGANVDVFAIKGNGQYTGNLNTVSEILSLKQFKNKYDRIIIQYHPSFYYANYTNLVETTQVHNAWREVFEDNPNIEVVCHEIIYPSYDSKPLVRNQLETAERIAEKNKWMACGKIIFHTQIEKNNFCHNLKISLADERLSVVPPNYYYVKNRDISKDEARKELKIPLEETVFLCIGFIQPHKSYDKVAEVFTKLDCLSSKKLYIVGSLRLVYDETIHYLNILEKYAQNNQNIHVFSQYVSDEAFDTWLIAADYVVIPYSEIWSSGVLGRAKLFHKTCIVRKVGGLEEQLESNDYLFQSYDELEDIVSQIS